MKEKLKPLNWLELQQLYKPVWDADVRKWRVVDGYREWMNDGKSVSFTDGNTWWDFDRCELYLEELEER